MQDVGEGSGVFVEVALAEPGKVSMINDEPFVFVEKADEIRSPNSREGEDVR